MFSIFLSIKNLSVFNPLVKISTTWTSVGQWCKPILPLHTWSLRKWNLVSICLLLPWLTGFLAKSMTDLLSICNSIFSKLPHFNSASKDNSQRPWHGALQEATYSASQVDKATTSCFLEFQDIGAPDNKNTKPEVLLLSTLSPHQSESV